MFAKSPCPHPTSKIEPRGGTWAAIRSSGAKKCRPNVKHRIKQRRLPISTQCGVNVYAIRPALGPMSHSGDRADQVGRHRFLTMSPDEKDNRG